MLVTPALGAPPGVAALAADLADAIQRDDASAEEAYGACVEAARAWLAAGAGFERQSGAAAAAAHTAERLATRGRALPVGQGGELLLTPRSAPRSRASSRQVAYAEHAAAVEDRAGVLAECVLDHAGLRNTVRVAARHHDAGKLDPRFQAWLSGGAVADPDRPLAKSGLPPNDPAARRGRQTAGYPAGKRHEATSAALLAAARALPRDVDRDLLLHLVAVHHGDGRPFNRVAPDPRPVDVSAEIEGAHVIVGSNDALPWHEHAERWVRLNARFGPWGLALLESLLVLADREVSAWEGT